MPRAAAWVIVSLLGLGAVLTSADAAGARRDGRPNIVFILADDWGWGDLHCYGHPRIRTPNLDRLASQGTRFTQYYQCGSVCSPSRTSIMTGRFPARFAMHGHLATHEQNQARGMPNWLDPETPTLPKLLQKSGYVTAHYGKWHLGNGEGAPMPDRYGFSTWKLGSAGPGPDEIVPTLADRPYSTTRIVDETIRFIRENQDRPFYVQAWLNDTHAILNPSDEQLAAYPNLQPKNLRFTAPQHIYNAVVTDADKQLGRLFQTLDHLGLTDNTLVVFTSDNGPEAIEVANAAHSGVGSPGPFRGRKRSLYEGGIRVPLIVRGPNVPANRVSEAILAGADWLPTLAALTGVPIPDGLPQDGEDRSACLIGPARERSRPLMWEWRFRIAGHVLNHSPILAIREGPWKLLMNPDRSRVELYNLPTDPTETDNLASQHPEVIARLAQRVLDWQKELPPGPFDPGAGSNAYPFPKAP